MFRRSLIGLVAVVVVLLMFAMPARAGGWAIITLDTLPQAVHAGKAFQLGFVIRQHGQTPVNNDWEGHTLKPLLMAKKQGGSQQAQFEARQQGAKGHFVVDVTLPSEGVWDWSIAAPPFYIQTTGQGDGAAAYFEPLTVLPAQAPAAIAPQPVAAPLLGLDPMLLRWAGVLLLIVAAGVALAAQRGRARLRRGVAAD